MITTKRVFFLVIIIALWHNIGVARIIANNQNEVILHLQARSDLQKIKFLKKIALVKYYIINGNLDQATIDLSHIDYQQGNLRFIAIRYRALIAFLKEDFQKSFNLLDQTYFTKNISAMRAVCTMQSYNMIALNKHSKLQQYFRDCKMVQGKYLTNNFDWPSHIVQLVLQNSALADTSFLKIKSNAFYQLDFLRAWLKESLYYNQEKEIHNYINKIPKEAYKNKEIRELLAMAFYRIGDYETSLHFLEKINAANAENIRGNIYLKENKLELAYGHFKLALKHKKDSKNAIERLIPLAWQLKQYDDSLKILNSYHGRIIDPIKKNTLFLAQLVNLKKYSQAKVLIDELDKSFPVNMPNVLSLLGMYTELMLKNKNKMQEYAAATCKNYDGLSCWLLMQSQIWYNITAFAGDKKNIAPNARYELEHLQQHGKITPLKENKTINQKEIEELDYGFYKL